MFLEVYAVQRTGRPHRAGIAAGAEDRCSEGRALGAIVPMRIRRGVCYLLEDETSETAYRLSAAPTRTGSGFLHLPQASRKGPNEIRACEHSDRMVGGSAREDH